MVTIKGETRGADEVKRLMYQYPAISIARWDLEQLGYKADGISNKQMKLVCRKLQEELEGEHFNALLKTIANDIVW